MQKWTFFSCLMFLLNKQNVAIDISMVVRKTSRCKGWKSIQTDRNLQNHRTLFSCIVLEYLSLRKLCQYLLLMTFSILIHTTLQTFLIKIIHFVLLSMKLSWFLMKLWQENFLMMINWIKEKFHHTFEKKKIFWKNSLRKMSQNCWKFSFCVQIFSVLNLFSAFASLPFSLFSH